jgi:uncharacterized protein
VHTPILLKAPFVLILILALEATKIAGAWLLYVGLLYIFGRLLHGLGTDGGIFAKGRMIGTLITLVTLAGLAGFALWRVYSRG